MRTVLSGILIFAIFVVVTQITNYHTETHKPELYEYVIHNYEEDCGTTNAVTSILLNYRMYDTMFEVLILLTAVIGMKQFLPDSHELTDEIICIDGKTRTMHAKPNHMEGGNV
jgi:multisubunit Na+/H+ antiporter MnhB subunit